jgi:hypothetical protein
MPPFHSRSAGALRIALRSSAGVIALVPDGSCSRRATDAAIGTDFADREYTPPPGLSSFWS